MFRLLPVAATALIALTAAAPPPPEADNAPDPAIVVTATPSEVARARAVEFIRAAGIAAGERTVARWVDPVCPRVLGLADQYAGIVETRMRAIAAAARVPVARAECKPNIVVSFVADAPGVVRAIARKAPRELSEVGGTSRVALLDGPAPVRWWYGTETKGADGMSQFVGDGNSIVSGTPTLQQYRSTIISTQTVRVIKAATVIVDLARVEGLPLTGVAAYAALVAFAEMRPVETPPPGSILGLFTADREQRGLGAHDSAFLGALYRLPLDRRAGEQRRVLVREIVAAGR